MLYLALAGAQSPLLSPSRCAELLQELARPPVRLSVSKRLALTLALAEAAPDTPWGQAGTQAHKQLLELLVEQLASSDSPSLRQQVRVSRLRRRRMPLAHNSYERTGSVGRVFATGRV